MLRFAMAGALLAVSVPAMAQTAAPAPVAHAGDDLPVDASSPAALVNMLHQMGYEADIIPDLSDSAKAKVVLKTNVGLKITMGILGRQNDGNFQMTSMKIVFPFVAAKEDWLATINRKSGFAKVIQDDQGHIVVYYGLLAQGMPRGSFRQTIDLVVGSASLVAKAMVAAGYVQTPAAPAAAPPKP